MADKRRTIVAPWRNIEEFKTVYDEIYGENSTPTTRRHALTQMRVWSLRRSLLCPAGVLATSVLLDAQLLDHDKDERFGESELQTLYANAFMRFFNFMSSIMQTHNLLTMYETAKQLGLESFVVDMRHLCAHGQQLPTLELLRSTTRYCMQWLDGYFWRNQLANMREVDARQMRRKDRTLFDDKLIELFSVYDAALQCHLKGAHNLKTSKRHVHGRHYVALKSYCETHELKELRPIFEMVVSEFSEILRRESSMKDLSDIYIDALLSMRYFFSIAGGHKTWKLLELLIEVTQSLFRMLAVFGLLEDLFSALLQHAESTIVDKARCAGAGFWAAKVVEGFVVFRKCKQMYKFELNEKKKLIGYHFANINVGQMSKAVLSVLRQNKVNIKRTLIFGDSVNRPWVWLFDRSFLQRHLEMVNEYTAPVLKALLPIVEPALSEDEMQAIHALIDALFCGRSAIDAVDEMDVNATAPAADNNDGIYTAADLLQRLQETPTTTKSPSLKTLTYVLASSDEKQQQYGLWSTVPDDAVNNWAICPLGKLPWG